MLNDMTHPDILKMERDGFFGAKHRVIDYCCVYGDEVYTNEWYYEIHDDIVCESCGADYMAQFLKAGT